MLRVIENLLICKSIVLSQNGDSMKTSELPYTGKAKRPFWGGYFVLAIGYNARHGSVAEWSIAAVLKTARGLRPS